MRPLLCTNTGPPSEWMPSKPEIVPPAIFRTVPPLENRTPDDPLDCVLTEEMEPKLVTVGAPEDPAPRKSPLKGLLVALVEERTPRLVKFQVWLLFPLTAVPVFVMVTPGCTENSEIPGKAVCNWTSVPLLGGRGVGAAWAEPAA